MGDIEFRAADTTIRRLVVDVFIVSQGDGVSEFTLVEGEIVLLKGESTQSAGSTMLTCLGKISLDITW